MVKLQVKNEPEIIDLEFEENRPSEAELELAKLEKKTRERESKTKRLEEKITNLEAENASLVAACDRLNSEIRRLDREKQQLQEQIGDQQPQFDSAEINDLISAVTTWISSARRTVERDRRRNRARGFQSEIERRDARLRTLLQKLQNM